MNMTDKPIFVKVDEYKDIIDILELTQDKLKKARSMLAKIQALKKQEDVSLETWKRDLDVVESRVTDIDQKLFHPR